MVRTSYYDPEEWLYGDSIVEGRCTVMLESDAQDLLAAHAVRWINTLHLILPGTVSRDSKEILLVVFQLTTILDSYLKDLS